jgi:serine phosphatase RsbU (regulator of sigma subunit)
MHQRGAAPASAGRSCSRYLEMVDGRARVGFARGGHPLPLLLRPDGAVEPRGAPGTLLGVVPDPQLEDRVVSLFPGDTLVFYTDGVVESRAGKDMLDEARLAALVSACARARRRRDRHPR